MTRNGSNNRFKIKTVLKEILNKYGGLRKEVKDVGKLLGCGKFNKSLKKYNQKTINLHSDLIRRSINSRFTKKKKSLIISQERSRLTNQTLFKKKSSQSCEKVSKNTAKFAKIKGEKSKTKGREPNFDPLTKSILPTTITKLSSLNITTNLKSRPFTNQIKEKPNKHTLEPISQKSTNIMNVTKKMFSPSEKNQRVFKLQNKQYFKKNTVEVGLSKNRSSKNVYSSNSENRKNHNINKYNSIGGVHRSVCNSNTKHYEELDNKQSRNSNKHPNILNLVNISVRNPELNIQSFNQNIENSHIQPFQFYAVSEAPSLAYNLPIYSKKFKQRYRT